MTTTPKPGIGQQILDLIKPWISAMVSGIQIAIQRRRERRDAKKSSEKEPL